MDNPHILERDLVYLAAIIDGEGTITLEKAGKRRNHAIPGLIPKIVVTNTNEAIIQHVINLFQNIGVTPHVKSQTPNGVRRRNRTCYWVQVTGLVKCKKVLTQIKQFLVGKISQANLLLDFIEFRGDPQMAKGKPYGQFELGILERVRAINFRGVSETDNRDVKKFIFAST